MTYRSIVNTLGGLVEVCHDAEAGFDACSAKVQADELRGMFGRQAQEWRDGARELRNLVVQHGGKPQDATQAGGPPERWTVALENVSGDLQLLEAAAAAQHAALERYRDALVGDELPLIVRTVVERQAGALERNRDALNVWLERLAGAV